MNSAGRVRFVRETNFASRAKSCRARGAFERRRLLLTSGRGVARLRNARGGSLRRLAGYLHHHILRHLQMLKDGWKVLRGEALKVTILSKRDLPLHEQHGLLMVRHLAAHI